MMTGATATRSKMRAREYLRSNVRCRTTARTGNDTGIIMAYKYVLPETVFWPQGSNAYPNYKTKTYNVVLFSPEVISGENPTSQCMTGRRCDYIADTVKAGRAQQTESKPILGLLQEETRRPDFN